MTWDEEGVVGVVREDVLRIGLVRWVNIGKVDGVVWIATHRLQRASGNRNTRVGVRFRHVAWEIQEMRCNGQGVAIWS